MSKKVFFIVAVFVGFFSYEEAFAVFNTDRQPSEMVILNLPDDEYLQWHEIHHDVNKKNGLVERAPLGQTIYNWSENISVMYESKVKWEKGVNESILPIIEHVIATTITTYPERKVSWRIIELNETDVIYEWMFHEEYNKIPPQNEIVRMFLTKTGIHRVGVTRKNAEMDPEEKEKWVNLLRNHAKVVSLQEAASTPQGLSLVNHQLSFIDEGENFRDWELCDGFASDSGNTTVSIVPPSQIGERYARESLLLFTSPNVWSKTIDQLLELERKAISSESFFKVDFQVLKRSPNEIVFTYSHPQDLLQLTSVVRIFATDQGVYSLMYIRILPKKLSQEKIAQWQARLEAIKVHDHL